MATGWDLDTLLGGRSAEDFVRDHFPDVSFHEVYGRVVCTVPDHFVTEEYTPFFQTFRNLFQVDLNQKVVELKPVRGSGDSAEQSARDVLNQIFDQDPGEVRYGQSRLVRCTELSGRSARPVAGKRYRVYPKNVQAEEGGAPQRGTTKVALASTFNAAGIIGVMTYHLTPKTDAYKYDAGFMLSLQESLFLVPQDRAT